MQFNSYFFLHLFTALIVLFFSLLVFLKNSKSKINISFSIFGLTIFVWLIFSSISSLLHEQEKIIFWFKASYTGIIIIPVTFSYFAACFTEKRKTLILSLGCIGAILFIFLLWFSDLFIAGTYKYPWGYYPKASLYSHPLFIVLFIFLFSEAFFSLFLKLNKMEGYITERLRTIYIILGTIFGVGGSIDFLPNYGVNIYPFGAILTVFYPGILTYAILRYRLLDIRIAVTRAGIFILVYTFILGLPIWFGLKTGLWFWTVLLMGILASTGPFVYTYLRQQVENVILKEQQRYQQSIRALAKRMTQIRELDKLFLEVVAEVCSVVRPQFIGLYTFSMDSKSYILYRNYLPRDYTFEKQIQLNSILVKMLSENKRSMLAESANLSNFPLETLVVPYFREGSLFGFLVLGKKSTKMLYTDSDFVTFDILSSQMSLAIENCIFWQEEKTRLAREEQIRRQKAMDHFSASLAHEIDNPLFAITGMADMVKEAVSTEFKNFLPQDKLDFLNDRLNRISKDLFRISKMIKAIREFSGQTKGELVLLNMDEVIETSLEIMAPQFKYEGIIFKNEVTPNLSVKGNKIHLEEIFVNIASNAIHAIKYNQKKEKEITLKIYKNTPKTLLVEFKDNGYGIKREMLEDIFLDFVTTKASSEGTGMGLGRVRKIVENHGGKIWAESLGEGKGASFFIELPLAEEIKK